jgi:hypothetical protein
MAENGLGLAKKLIWNRRYKAWKTWFYSLVIVAIFCVFKDNTEILKIYAMWSTVGLVALVGGLSATDFIKLKNGVS